MLPLSYRGQWLREHWGRVVPDMVALVAICLAFCWICFRHLEQPGIYEDEVWSALPAARFVLGKSIVDPVLGYPVNVLGRSIPFMLNSYVGPVKTYVMIAAYSLFGVSITVTRVTMGAVALVATVIFYLLVRREFGRVAAIFAGLLLATDLNWILMSRDDWGPIALAVLARVCALYGLLGWWRNHQSRWLFVGSLSLGLGLSHKFDFLGFTLACGLASVVFYDARQGLRWRNTAIALGGFLLGAWPMLLLNILTGGATLRESRAIAQGMGLPDFPTTIEQVSPYLHFLPGVLKLRAATLAVVLNGTSTANWMLGDAIEARATLGASLMPWAVVVAIIVLPWLMLLRSFRTWRRPAWYCLIVFGLTFLSTALTPFAIGAHHIVAVYPLPHLLVGLALAGLWQVGRGLPAWAGWFARGVAVVSLVGIVSANLFLAQAFYGRLATQGGRGAWSEAIYDVYDVLQRDYAGQTIQLMDWGFEKPLVMLGQGRLKLATPYWRASTEDSRSPWLGNLVTQPNQVFVVYADKFVEVPTAQERFKQAYQQQPNVVVEEQRFYQKNGEHVISLLRFRATGPPAPTQADGIGRPSPSLVIKRLYPERTGVGQGFNIQPDGQTVLAVGADGATPDTVLVFGTRILDTAYAGPTGVNAIVPSSLYSQPGQYEIYLRNPTGESNRVTFSVDP